jgi:gas vesicle protein
MIEKVKKSLSTGVLRIKWMAGFLAERTKAETSVARFMYEKTKLEDRINDLYSDVGKRVRELKEKGEGEILKDFMVQQTLDEIKTLQESVDDYKEQAHKINKLPD